MEKRRQSRLKGRQFEQRRESVNSRDSPAIGYLIEPAWVIEGPILGKRAWLVQHDGRRNLRPEAIHVGYAILGASFLLKDRNVHT